MVIVISSMLAFIFTTFTLLCALCENYFGVILFAICVGICMIVVIFNVLWKIICNENDKHPEIHKDKIQYTKDGHQHCLADVTVHDNSV